MSIRFACISSTDAVDVTRDTDALKALVFDPIKLNAERALDAHVFDYLQLD